jgi:hypothetical protein
LTTARSHETLIGLRRDGFIYRMTPYQPEVAEWDDEAKMPRARKETVN